jgi:hypothetical protein
VAEYVAVDLDDGKANYKLCVGNQQHEGVGSPFSFHLYLPAYADNNRWETVVKDIKHIRFTCD